LSGAVPAEEGDEVSLLPGHMKSFQFAKAQGLLDA
jgi:hypothetical protein